ncbi:hypothetical protein AVEN_185077-1 [Araneus ventricosus]|uniref:Mos1 transposase HTH domain-containing protein n=1 Tax=Araneus ventricosus TaxID=182803 RepID=A0A4Y2BS34_ARAVE|nr:hypothetical protein AVEN_185077-1 [Araneus ventricosus]
MFTKAVKRSWIKIKVARGHNAQHSYEVLRNVCGDVELSDCTVPRWVKMFRERWDATQDKQCFNFFQADSQTIQLVACLLKVDRPWTSQELAAEVGKLQKIVFQILQETLGYHKIVVRRTSRGKCGAAYYYEILRHDLHLALGESDIFCCL